MSGSNFTVKKAFEEWSDLWHLTLGLICRFTLNFNRIISLIILLIYIVYQAVEKELKVETAMDYIEFILGFIIGEIILS